MKLVKIEVMKNRLLALGHSKKTVDFFVESAKTCNIGTGESFDVRGSEVGTVDWLNRPVEWVFELPELED